ncbi:MAG: hypothetical protein M1505_02220 [Patescibacteria group bacterium]|nr:hypothetical protein [Patescibacteria group bacterium]MCL5258017.1 hypothetical protein [Patescibacteria group bacterium]
MKNKYTAFRYSLALFAIIVFLWWFQGGDLLPFLAPKPSPAEVIVVGTANALKSGMANIFNIVSSIGSGR